MCNTDIKIQMKLNTPSLCLRIHSNPNITAAADVTTSSDDTYTISDCVI